MAQDAVLLSQEMTEIISAAIAAGLGSSAEEIVLLALRSSWADYQASVTGLHAVHAALREAAADVRPGKPIDEVFTRLTQCMDQRADAA